jgi:hypothetical protein
MGRKSTNGQAGEVSNSRRSWLTQQFVEALARDWEENGPQVIERLRVESPTQYAKIVADLLPKVQTESAADQFAQVTSLEALVEKLARDISDWGMADKFIALLSNRQHANGDAAPVS